MTQNMKHIRSQTSKAADPEDNSASEDEDENSPAAIKRRHKRELERAERENRENTSALLELRDLEDEMTTLYKLFEAQESIIKTMKTFYSGKDLTDLTSNGQAYLDEALECLDEYKQQTQDILKKSDTVRKDVSRPLYLIQSNRETVSLTFSPPVRENARDGAKAGAGRRGPLVAIADGVGIQPEPVCYDLHHLHRHLPPSQLLHRAVWRQRLRVAG